MTMKEISIVIRTDDLAQVTEILSKHNVGGITFYEINGASRVRSYLLIAVFVLYFLKIS
jgi:nitrogen regulatory protein PII